MTETDFEHYRDRIFAAATLADLDAITEELGRRFPDDPTARGLLEHAASMRRHRETQAQGAPTVS